jgi:signal transduction histidine kinase
MPSLAGAEPSAIEEPGPQGPASRRRFSDLDVWRGSLSLVDTWNRQSLARQFLIAGGIVWLTAMLIIGAVVTNLIREAVIRNSAAATALYVDGIIAPILPDLKTQSLLDDVTSRALDETFAQAPLRGRIFSFKLWRADGVLLYSTDKAQTGRQYSPSPALRKAFTGQIVAEFGLAEDPESEAERKLGKPLLEIYNPVLQPWSGEVVAVSEFYEVADDFRQSLNEAQTRSWLAVAGTGVVIFLLLSAIVLRGSRTIDSQQRVLAQRVDELSQLLEQNRQLRQRVQLASQRTTALNESYLRRLGADLHDGPAQLIAYAALRMESRFMRDPTTPPEARSEEIAAIKSRLEEAMNEIRSICSGLVLPHIEHVDLAEVIRNAATSHERRTSTPVALSLPDASPAVSPSAKICIYRFVQEALNNSYRHAEGKGQSISLDVEGHQVVVEVCDRGPGFDPARVRPEGLGLSGMRERIASLGGDLDIVSSSTGTCLRLRLGLIEMEHEK